MSLNLSDGDLKLKARGQDFVNMITWLVTDFTITPLWHPSPPKKKNPAKKQQKNPRLVCFEFKTAEFWHLATNVIL